MVPVVNMVKVKCQGKGCENVCWMPESNPKTFFCSSHCLPEVKDDMIEAIRKLCEDGEKDEEKGYGHGV